MALPSRTEDCQVDKLNTISQNSHYEDLIKWYQNYYSSNSEKWQKSNIYALTYMVCGLRPLRM